MGDLAEILWEMERGLDQVQFMLRVITAFIGVIVATIVVYGIVIYTHSKRVKKTVLASLQSEIKMNLSIVDEVCEVTNHDCTGCYDTIPLSETAWVANISGQGLTRLDKDVVEPLTQTYARVHRANVYAARIEEKEYNPEYAAQYNTYLKAAQDDMAKTLKLLEQRK